jgi:hypothetical protein
MGSCRPSGNFHSVTSRQRSNIRAVWGWFMIDVHHNIIVVKAGSKGKEPFRSPLRPKSSITRLATLSALSVTHPFICMVRDTVLESSTSRCRVINSLSTIRRSLCCLLLASISFTSDTGKRFAHRVLFRSTFSTTSHIVRAHGYARGSSVNFRFS